MSKTQTYADLLDAGSPQGQLVLQAIARTADWETGTSKAKIKTIAHMSNCSDKTARRHSAILAKKGLIGIERRQGSAGNSLSNAYSLIGYQSWLAGENEAPLDDGGEGVVKRDVGTTLVRGGLGHPPDQGSGQLVAKLCSSSFLENSSTPLSPRPGGSNETEIRKARFAKGWDSAAIAAADELLRDPVACHVIRYFVHPVAGTFSPPRGSDGAAFVYQLSARLARFSSTILREVAEVQRDHSQRNSGSNRLRVAALIERDADRIEALAHTPKSVLPKTVAPEMLVAWSGILDRLAARLGKDRVRIYFNSASPERLSGDALVIAAPAFICREIEDKCAVALREACNAVLGVSTFELRSIKHAPIV